MNRGATTAAPLYANALHQFSACRQPWNEYINLLVRQDSKPYHTENQEAPAYRGRKRGREGWLFSQQVQLHYHRFPDEQLFTNLARWRAGDTVGDIALQQFRNAQPFQMEEEDPQGYARPSREVYMKLNYKNPATISRFLTRTGHFYPQDILPMHPEAVVKLRVAKAQAMRIGLYPKSGNPFWYRSQKFRPKAYKDAYDPTTYSTRHTVEHFAYNWVQTDRIRRYFAALEGQQGRGTGAGAQHHSSGGNKAGAGMGGAVASAQQRQQFHFYSDGRTPLDSPAGDSDPHGQPQPHTSGMHAHRGEAAYTPGYPVQKSIKNPTVPGLMSTKGMKKKFHNLYSATSTKRMGFTNPTLGIKKI